MSVSNFLKAAEEAFGDSRDFEEVQTLALLSIARSLKRIAFPPQKEDPFRAIPDKQRPPGTPEEGTGGGRSETMETQEEDHPQGPGQGGPEGNPPVDRSQGKREDEPGVQGGLQQASVGRDSQGLGFPCAVCSKNTGWTGLDDEQIGFIEFQTNKKYGEIRCERCSGLE